MKILLALVLCVVAVSVLLPTLEAAPAANHAPQGGAKDVLIRDPALRLRGEANQDIRLMAQDSVDTRSCCRVFCSYFCTCCT